jgi:predicted secreted protein
MIQLILSLVMRRWAFIVAGAVVLGIAAAAMKLWRQSGGGLPKQVATQLARNDAASALDSAAIADAVAKAALQDSLRLKALAQAKHEAHFATAAGAHAKALAVTARVATTAEDSAARWQRAYEAQAEQVRALQEAKALTDSALVHAEVRSSMLDQALLRSEAHVARGDSLIRELTEVAERPGGSCHILALLPCPSRHAVVVVTAAVTVGAIVALRALLQSVPRA